MPLAKNMIGDFFEENYQYFKKYLRSRFNKLNEYDVEDIIQQTTLKLLYKGDDFLSISNLSAYMFTSLQNNAKDYFKKANRIQLQSEDIDGTSPTVEEEILKAELKHYIIKAINSLDIKSKYVFIETEIKGRSYDELVEETGEKLGTLLSRKSRAKKKLQKEILNYIRRY